MIPTDPLFSLQWYLLNTGQTGGTAGIDINVVDVWDEFTGQGVDIGIISKQLGHRSIATTARYLDHIAPQQVIEAMRKRSWRAWSRTMPACSKHFLSCNVSAVAGLASITLTSRPQRVVGSECCERVMR